MNVKDFIESGILEEYCLGLLNDEDKAFVIQMTLLYPEVKAELTRLELFMENLARANAIEVSNPNLKQKILRSISNVSKNCLDINNLPLIDKNTDHRLWFNTLKHLIPAKPAGDMIFEILRRDAQVTQSLVISKVNVPEETHDDVLENILILRGECECTIGKRVFRAKAGDLIEIPLHIEHNIKITTPYVVAVLQHLMV